MPLISVIVPVYKVECYLRSCVDSILAQTFPDFELILVDDGSPDGCGEICEKYAKKDARVSVIHQANGGLSAARNAGLAVASCDWVCFIDSDDLIHPDMLKLLYHAAESPEVNMAICDCVQAPAPPEDFCAQQDDSLSVKPVTEALLQELFLEKKRAYWTVVPVLVKTEIARRYPFTCGRIFEDNAVSVCWLYEAKTVAFLDAKLYFYRVNADGIVNAPFSEKKLDFLWALEEQLAFFEQKGFRAMQGAVAREYVLSALFLAQKAKTEAGDEKLARSVIKKAAHIRKRYADRLNLTEEEAQKLFNAAHPVLHRIKKKRGYLLKK